MTDVFACARAQIYYNSKRKPLAQVKRETGCSHIINGYLFNGSFQPVGWTVIDGKVISRDAYQDWGISIGSDGKPQMLTDRGGSFLSGVPLLKNGAKLERSLTPDVARSAARTAVGWMPDGRICLWCDKTSLTREQLQNKLLGLGVADALMLDGGGSTQGFFPSGKVASSRKVPTMVLFWEDRFSTIKDSFQIDQTGEERGPELGRKIWDPDGGSACGAGKSRYPTGIGGNSASASKINSKNRGGFYESFPDFLLESQCLTTERSGG